MSGETITLELGEATKEQLEKALERACDGERRCNEQGSWWQTWTTRREALERALSARRRLSQPNKEQRYREQVIDEAADWLKEIGYLLAADRLKADLSEAATASDNQEQRYREALAKIASCERRAPGDVVDIARAALKEETP